MIEHVIELFLGMLKALPYLKELNVKGLTVEERQLHNDKRREASHHLTMAQCLPEEKQKWLEKAYDLYQEATAFESTPDQMADTYYEFGQVCAQLAWYTEAVQKWRKALSYKPCHDDALKGLAYLCLQLAKMIGGKAALPYWRQAEKCFKKLMRCVPWEANQHKPGLEECRKHIAKHSCFGRLACHPIQWVAVADTLMIAREGCIYGI